jgi:hypothetical protein
MLSVSTKILSEQDFPDCNGPHRPHEISTRFRVHGMQIVPGSGITSCRRIPFRPDISNYFHRRKMDRFLSSQPRSSLKAPCAP